MIPSRRGAALAGLMIIALLGACWLAVTSLSPARQAGDSPEASHPLQQSEDTSRRSEGAPASAGSDTDQLPPVGQAEMSSAPREPEGAARLKVKCVDKGGAALSDVHVRCFGPGLANLDNDERRDGGLVGKTDDAGEFEIEVSGQGTVAFSVVDEEWYGRHGPVPAHGTDMVVMILQRAAALSFRVQYEDGAAASGFLRLRQSLPQTYASETVRLNERGQVRVTSVPVESPLWCMVATEGRVGYEGLREELGVVQLNSGNELLIIVPKSNRTGGIRVEFDASVNDPDAYVQIEAEIGAPQTKQLLGDKQVLEWNGLPAPRMYRLTLFGEQAWRSEWMSVQVGEVTVVHAVLQAGATVRARLVDESGMPIQDGILRVPNGSYVRYDERGKPWMSPHRSDLKGVVRLAGLPAGELALEAEAHGRGIVEISVNVPIAGDVELGEVILQLAAGELEIELVGARPGVPYHVGLIEAKAFGSFVRASVPVKNGRHSITGLPLRAYRVGITPARYGRVKNSEIITLTATVPRAMVRIDVSDLDPAQGLPPSGK